MPYKIKPESKRRFIKGTGERFMADGVTVRCQAVKRTVTKPLRKINPNLKARDLWPEHQCKRSARPGYFVCYLHGAGKINGPGPGEAKKQVAKATSYIKADLADKYRTFAEDPELFNMRHTASLMQARNAELLEDLEEGSLAHPKKVEALYKGLDMIDAGDAIGGAKLIRSVLGSLEKERAAWDEIRKNAEVFKNLTNAEISRQKEMRLAMSQEQVFNLIDRIGELIYSAVTETVEIPEPTQNKILNRVAGGLRDIIGNGARALIESSTESNGKKS